MTLIKIFGFLIVIASQSVWGAFEPTIGARVSVAGGQELLAAPPLPRLETGGKTTVSPQAGFMNADIKNSETQSGSSFKYSGNLYGPSGGVGFTWPTKGRLGWFLFGAVGNLSGSTTASDASGTKTYLNDMESQLQVAAGGFSYRFIGDSKSVFKMGFFLGPALMNIYSSYVVDTNTTGLNQQTLKMSPLIFGTYSGLQLSMTIWRFYFNPYALIMYEMDEKCKKIEATNGAFTGSCSSNPNKFGYTDLNASFIAYGLFLGYKKLRINVYSKVADDGPVNDLKITNYSLSYTFGMDDVTGK